MAPLQHSSDGRFRAAARPVAAAVGAVALALTNGSAQDTAPDPGAPPAGENAAANPVDALPRAVVSSHFDALMRNSPFTRSLNLSDSLILRGVAMIDGRQVATVLNRETKEIYTVSDDLNAQGWKMVEYRGDPDIEKTSARIAVAGGEVVTVRYGDIDLKPGEAKPAAGPSGGDVRLSSRTREGRRGFGGGPPPEVREKMDRLSEDQRAKLFEHMSRLRYEKPDMSFEDRIKVFREMLDKMDRKAEKKRD